MWNSRCLNSVISTIFQPSERHTKSCNIIILTRQSALFATQEFYIHWLPRHTNLMTRLISTHEHWNNVVGSWKYILWTQPYPFCNHEILPHDNLSSRIDLWYLIKTQKWKFLSPDKIILFVTGQNSFML